MARALYPIKHIMKACYIVKYRLATPLIVLIGLLAFKTAFSQNLVPPNMPHPRVGMCSARLGAKLFLIGGAQKMRSEDLSSILSDIRGTSIVEAFDFNTMSWDTNIARLNTPRAYATAVSLDDSIYVMGGINDSGRVLNTVEVYDPSKNSWHYGPSMLRHREGAASVVYGDSIFVFGGGSMFDGSNILHRLVEIYSPKDTVWTTDSDSTMTLGRIFLHAVKIGSAVYIFGGLGSFGPVGYVEKYIPGRSVVQIRFVWRFPRAYFDFVQKGDSIFVISGYGSPPLSTNAQGCYQDVELLNFGITAQDTGIEEDAGMTNPRVGFIAQLANGGEIYLFGGLSPDYVQQPLATVGEVLIPTAIQENPDPIPKNFLLEQNYPNPFNPSTAIAYQLSAASEVTLEVFDVLGREVAVLVSEWQTQGNYKVTFDGSNLSSGLYFYRLSAGGFVATKKMILTK